MGLPKAYKSLASTWIQTTVCGLILAIVVHTVIYANSSTKIIIDCSQTLEKDGGFKNFSEFYPFYLCEHSLPVTKLFHFVATFNAAIFLLMALNAKASSTKLRCLAFALVQAYGMAWISHFFLEQNKPATFKYPSFSFMADWVMFKDALVGKHALF